MKIMEKLSTYAALIGVIGAIGGGFYTWGQFNLRLDQIEAKTKKSVNLNPVKESVATLTTRVDNLENRMDRTENIVDKVGNNDNPLAN